MRVARYFTLCMILVATFVSSVALAQQPDPNVCAVIANKITPDISSQSTSYDRFAVFQQLIRDQRFQSFDTANSTSLDVGLSVVGYVDLFLGTRSNSSNWRQNWQNFLQATYSQAGASFDQSKFISTWSPNLITAIANCNNFYGILTTVTQGHDAFSIKVHGIGQWNLLGIATSPQDSAFACGGDEKASPQQPISFVDDHILQCRKDPNVTLLVTIHNSQAEVGPFTIYSISDDLRKEQADQLQQLQTTMNLLQTQLSKTNSILTAIGQARPNLPQWSQGNAGNAGPVCPAGQHVVGITYQSSAGGPRGIIYVVAGKSTTIKSLAMCSTPLDRHWPSLPTRPATASKAVSRSQMKARCPSFRAASLRPEKPFVLGAFTDDATKSKTTSGASKIGCASERAFTQDAPVTDCDTYAANDVDPLRKSAGMPISDINPTLAVPACKTAARKYPNSSRLIYQLGRAYHKANNFSAALAQYRKAVENGYVAAQLSLGLMYYNGQGAPQDFAQAFAWFRKAADQGYAAAQYNLGMMYEHGEGVPQDYAQAIAWYRKAADQGIALARSSLARLSAAGASPNPSSQAPILPSPSPPTDSALTPLSPTTATDDKQWLEFFVTANGGCASDVFAPFRMQSIQSQLKQNNFTTELFGKPILKWSDDDMETAIRVFRDCHAKRDANSVAGCMRMGHSQSDCEGMLRSRPDISPVSGFEHFLRETVTLARDRYAQQKAEQQAQIEQEKVEPENKRAQTEEAANRNQEQLLAREQGEENIKGQELEAVRREHEQPKLREAEARTRIYVLKAAYEQYIFIKRCYDIRQEHAIYIADPELVRAREAVHHIEEKLKPELPPGASTDTLWSGASISVEQNPFFQQNVENNSLRGMCRMKLHSLEQTYRELIPEITKIDKDF